MVPRDEIEPPHNPSRGQRSDHRRHVGMGEVYRARDKKLGREVVVSH